MSSHPTPEREYDDLVGGGGTAGVVAAVRLAAHGRVGLLEAGPSGEGDERVLDVRRWPDLLDLTCMMIGERCAELVRQEGTEA